MIDSELQHFLPPLSTDEKRRLEESLLKEGCRDPIVLCDGKILDGHNRYAICQKYGLSFQTVEKNDLKTLEDKKRWMIQNQLAKRNLSDYARYELVKLAAEFVKDIAKANALLAKTKNDLPSFRIRTDETLAKMAGMGKMKYREATYIDRFANDSEKERVRQGEKIHSIYKEVKYRLEGDLPYKERASETISRLKADVVRLKGYEKLFDELRYILKAQNVQDILERIHLLIRLSAQNIKEVS